MFLNVCKQTFHHSQKKRKDSLETQAKGTVLRAYVENQTILELILLYRTLKYKQQQKKIGLLRVFVNPHFLFLCD